MWRGAAIILMTILGLAGAASDAEAWRGDDEQATCKSAYGQTVCGYGCVAAYGEVRCAKRPGGICKAAYGEVVCWDAPQRGRRHRDRELARDADCLSAYGKTECGYGCKAAYGDVKCGARPGATCIAAYGEIACGFGCQAAYGQVRCAQRPGGTCVAAYGEVTCSR